MTRSFLARAVALLALTAGLAAAQQFPFQLLVTSGANVISVANGTTLPFNIEVGQSQSFSVKATYIGTSQATITLPPQLLGAVTFTVSFKDTLPLVLNRGDSTSFDIAYRPTSASAASAQLTIFFTEPVASTTGGTPTTSQNSILLSLQGTSPSFQLSYFLQATPNVVPLASGGSILFPGTQTNTTALTSLNTSNLGSGAGTIKSITPPAGPAFKLTGLPLLPATLAAGNTLQLQVSYNPTAVGTDNDQVQITLASGTVLTVNLSGSGISATFTYQLLQGDTPTPVTPPGPITLPDTNLGDTSSLIVRVQNVGNADGAVNAAALAGLGFSLSDTPLFPQTLKPSDSFTFTINFAPTQPGAQKGQLVIGKDLFTVTGNGLGPKLAFSYVSGAGSIDVSATGAVVFGPIIVTQSEQVTFVITNKGTLPAKVSNIGIGESKSPFSVSGLPAFPVSLDPGGTTQFVIKFAPLTTGFLNGTLRVDTTIIVVTGSGNEPPPLPTYTIQGPTGNVAPQTQPAVSLKLASAYPVALVGTLTLTTSSTQVSDPAVQFSTGGRVVPFLIPANSTDANFGGLGPQIFLQTGTVATSIILTPAFLTQDGGLDITPTNPATLQFTVPSAAPTLLAVQVTGATTNGFTVSVFGYSTTRSVNSMTLQFTPATGFNFSASQVTVDLKQASAAWFQSSTSTSFGGQFTVAVPFTLQGTVATNQTLLQAIASVSATVSNDQGTSNSVQQKLQ
ncbi:MAG: choice-of-anchor D domain-containing protein [Acidobacteriia bacterium]|nr:choice-of-anchor D domain-containing protein [Terriglobia bacterium]